MKVMIIGGAGAMGCVIGRTLPEAGNDVTLLSLARRLLAFLSHVMTLDPGGIVTTGTPAGVGVFRAPRVFLQPGDRVVLEIDRIGRIENPVVAED